MRKAIPIMPRPNLVRVSMTSEVGIGGAVVSLPVDPPGAAVVAYWFMLSRAASSVKACSSCKNFPEKNILTCNVSPKRIVNIGMNEPQPKAMVRANTMRKVSRGEANLN